MSFLSVPEWAFVCICSAIVVVGAPVSWTRLLDFAALGLRGRNPVAIALYAANALWVLAATADIVLVFVGARRLAKRRSEYGLGRVLLAGALFFGLLGGVIGLLWMLVFLFPLVAGPPA